MKGSFGWAIWRCFCAVCFMAGWGSTAYAQYMFIDLSPTNIPGVARSFGFGAGGGQQAGYFVDAQGHRKGLLETGNPGMAVDFTPSSASEAILYGTDGAHQAGWAILDQNSGRHAVVWSGSKDNYVDLGMPGQSSEAHGLYGPYQVGLVNSSGTQHAALWAGSAASLVDLNPSGYSSSTAEAIYGTTQAGYGLDASNRYRALLWSGTAASAVDLTPVGFTQAFAAAAWGGQQGGRGYVDSPFDSYSHALLWSGNAASAIDLTPTAFSVYETAVVGMAGSKEVGYGNSYSGPGPGARITSHAIIWTGSAASAVDLNVFMPSQYTDATAESVDAAGNIVGFATVGGVNHIVMWSALTPEPSPTVVLASLLAACGLIWRVLARSPRPGCALHHGRRISLRRRRFTA